MTKIGQDLIQSAKEALFIARGETLPATAFVPPSVNVTAIRKKTKLSQARFANRYGFSPASVRDWEQKRRNPDSAARTLLLIIDREPEAVLRALDIA